MQFAQRREVLREFCQHRRREFRAIDAGDLISLPTMRTLDLVDFSAVDPEFAEIALRCIVQLGDDTSFMSPRYAE